METPERPTILIVDDSPDNLRLINVLLRDTFRTKVATNGDAALQIARTWPYPDLILLDVEMPGLDGYETCIKLKGDPRSSPIPIIFLTARNTVEDEERGLVIGAVDYITKPISPAVLRTRVQTHLALRNARSLLENRNIYLEEEVRQRTQELSAVQDLTILAMTMISATRDNETGRHVRRTQRYFRLLGESLRDHKRFRRELGGTSIDLLSKSAALHDLGKVGIPDAILNKPGSLTPEERKVMERHTIIGRDAFAAVEREIGHPSSFLCYAQAIAYSHHERWDGKGYPEGLKGEEIPFAARLMAVADVYDALVSRRVYKPAMSHDMALQIIHSEAGRHLDPDVALAFCDIGVEVSQIASSLSDGALEAT